MEDITQEEIESLKVKIDGMSHEDMARYILFTPAGDPIFRTDLPLLYYFTDRFNSFGGMTPAVSKKIGWG